MSLQQDDDLVPAGEVTVDTLLQRVQYCHAMSAHALRELVYDLAAALKAALGRRD